MLKKTFFNNTSFRSNDINYLFDLRLPQQDPENILTKLSSPKYLRTCQNYISPLSKNNLVYQLILYKYYQSQKEHQKIYHDIAIKIATKSNIIYKNPDGYSPIHLAFEIEDFRFLSDLISLKKEIIIRQPYDKVLISILRQDPNPVDEVYDFYTDHFFIKT